jgi:hypothetical protein
VEIVVSLHIASQVDNLHDGLLCWSGVAGRQGRQRVGCQPAERMPPLRPFGMVHSAVPRHVGAVLGQLDEGRHLAQDAGRVWQLLLRLYLRLILRAQLVLDALAELNVPAPVDGPQDLAEACVVMRCHRGVKLVTVHPVRWHGTRS